MGKVSKDETLKKIIRSRFCEESFLDFSRDILKVELFSDLSGDIIGEFEDLKGKIALIKIDLSKDKDLESYRRKQRNYVGDILRESGRYKKALVAFYNTEKKYWKLSCVEIDNIDLIDGIGTTIMKSHIFNQDKSRFSYEVLKKLIKGVEKIDVFELFNQRKLVSDFFNRYRKKMLELKEICFEQLGERYSDRTEVDELVEISSKRIMMSFLLFYFVEKKGWLGARADQKLEEGNKFFIEDYFNSCIQKGFNFYEKGSELLLEGAINNPNLKDRILERVNLKFPYLDNFLLNPYDESVYKREELELSNDFFLNGEDGLIDIFKRYHFSLIENEPYLQDISIDPEIIGMVFENLLDENYRKNKGTFYTPRVIVHHMCKEVLINSIYRNFNGIKKDEIVLLVRYGEFILDHDRNKNYIYFKMPKNILKNLKALEEFVLNIKVIEPSVGSGAFLLGMMGELLKLRKVVNRYRKMMDKIQDVELCNHRIKLDIIKNNLYGVDIDYAATETTKVRMWLSLIVDSNKYIEEIHSKPKGNILQRDSLNLNWEEEFFKRYGIDGGMDIVIGNPPYIGEKGNKELFRKLSKSDLGKRFYMGRGDIFYFFFHMGIDLLKKYGTLAYITTNYYLTADGALNLRKDLKERTNILKLENFNEVNVFSKARGQHNIITILEKSLENDSRGEVFNCLSKGDLSEGEMSLYLRRQSRNGRYIDFDQEELYKGENYYIHTEKADINSILNKISKGSIPLKELVQINQGLVSGADKVTKRHIEKFQVESDKGSGIFVVSRKELSNLNLSNFEKEFIKTFYKNSDIDHYTLNKKVNNYVIYLDKSIDIKKLPNICKHLERYRDVLESKRETIMGRLPWYSLHWPRKREIFEGEKIVSPQRSRVNKFAYSDGSWYASADVYYLTKRSEGKVNLKYILALLNSKLYYVWLFHRGKRKGNLLELYRTPLEEVPIKVIDKKIINEVIDLVDQILNNKRKKEVTVLDEIIYKIYNLSQDEIEEVERFYFEKIFEEASSTNG